MKTKRGVAVALAGVLILGFAGPVFAANGDEASEETALLGTKLTLLQAIARAEQQTGGKAFDGATPGVSRPTSQANSNGGGDEGLAYRG